MADLSTSGVIEALDDIQLANAVRLELNDASVDDDTIEHYLLVAQSAVIQRLYPFRSDIYWEDVPWKYHNNAIQIAAYLISKRGAEGETQHSESGTTRTYECAEIPACYFRGITPYAEVI